MVFMLRNSTVDAPSIISIATLVGALTLSLTGAIGFNGSVGFVAGVGVSVTILILIKIVQGRSFKKRLSEAAARDISTTMSEAELARFQNAILEYLVSVVRRSGRQEWK